MRTENTPMHRKLVIDYRLVAEGYLFASNRDRCLYLGKSVRQKRHWLEANVGRFRPLADVEKEAAQLGAPGESKNNVEAALAELNGQTSPHDVAKKGDDENDVASVDTLAVECSPSHEPTPLPASEIIKNETMPLEPLRRTKVAMSETEGSRTETTPLGAMGRKRGRSGGGAKAGGMLSPERMRIVLDSLRECPILWVAASKAGIHRRTLEYWIKRSRAGDAGYDVEWQGEIWRFHEHCESAIEEADDKVLEPAWYIAMGADLKDEDGKVFPHASWKQQGKMIRFLLEWQRPEVWGKHRKIEVPHKTGVLVVGDKRRDVPKKVDRDTTASVKARKWKAGWRMIQKMKA
jgi:hypothetical protein